MIEILRQDFKYSVSYNYDTVYSCEESGCNEEGICRCGYITNTHLNSVDVPAIVALIYNNLFDKSLSTKRHNAIQSLWGITEEIDRYTIDRILRINKIWEPGNWQINVCNGYYGQEIEDVVVIEDVVQKLDKDIQRALDLDDLTDRIEYLLKLENGPLLDSIKGSKYRIDKVDRDDIDFPNKSHLNRIIIDDLEHYSDKVYTGIRGILKKDGQKWRVIDGYHRLSKSENKMIKVLIVE